MEASCNLLTWDRKETAMNDAYAQAIVNELQKIAAELNAIKRELRNVKNK